jgi:hypothetical protein
MKLICYSLFNSEGTQNFEKLFYLRGLYWNCRMNAFLFPDWRTHLEVSRDIYEGFHELFDWLVANNNLSFSINEENHPKRCEGMLRRMKPIFDQNVTHILCRDADALSSYREALVVQKWLESNKKCHAILDNRAHSGLMGGMTGFQTSWFRGCMEMGSWEQMISGWDFSQHGSDQNWLNAKVLPRIKDDLMWSGGPLGDEIPDAYSQAALPQVSPMLWEANLISSFIGSPGFNEVECIRFFRRFDKEPSKFEAIEKQFPKLFYWHL